MIIARQRPSIDDKAQNSHGSISDKLARLRREARAHERNLASREKRAAAGASSAGSYGGHTFAAPSSTVPTYGGDKYQRIAFVASSFGHDAISSGSGSGHGTSSTIMAGRRHDGELRTAGPRAPRSWSLADRDKISESVARRNEERRQSQLASSRPETTTTKVQSLAYYAARWVVKDFSRPNKSLFLRDVDCLAPHLRLYLFDVAALVAPLHEQAISALLSAADAIDEDSHSPNETADDWWSDQAISSAPLSDAWPHSYLTTLNLSFSHVTLSFLTSLLLLPSPSTSSSSASQGGGVPAFPVLDTLLLTGTRNLALSPAFFDLMARLTSLKSLSLAHKSITDGTLADTAPTTTTSTMMDEMEPVAYRYVLRRLSIATSTTLRHLDVSQFVSSPSSSGDTDFDFEALAACIAEVDWSNHWLHLESLTLIGDVEADEEASVRTRKAGERRERIRELVTRSGRKRWLDVVTGSTATA